MDIMADNKLHNIELDAYSVLAILNVVKDSCTVNDYHAQSSVLEMAISKQQQIIEAISLLY